MFGLKARRRERNERVSSGRPRRTVLAKQLWEPRRGAIYTLIASTDLAKGDCVLVEAGDVVPGDGEVVEGTALVADAPILGEGAPGLRELGGAHPSVTGGTLIRSGWLVIRLTADGDATLLDS